MKKKTKNNNKSKRRRKEEKKEETRRKKKNRRRKGEGETRKEEEDEEEEEGGGRGIGKGNHRFHIFNTFLWQVFFELHILRFPCKNFFYGHDPPPFFIQNLVVDKKYFPLYNKHRFIVHP